MQEEHFPSYTPVFNIPRGIFQNHISEIRPDNSAIVLCVGT